MNQIMQSKMTLDQIAFDEAMVFNWLSNWNQFTIAIDERYFA